MDTNIKKFQKLVNKSQNILLVLPPTPGYDLLTSAFALFHLLKNDKKEVAIFGKNLDYGKNQLSFLPQPSEQNYLNSLDGARDFLLIFNTKYNKIINIETQEKKNEVVIRLTPEKGVIDPRDFSLAPADFKYDLAIIIGAPTLESLGPIYNENTDLFFEVPKINISNNSDNDDYGQVNLVDLTAPAVSEIIGEIITEINPQLLTQGIAQTLLTGIISATDSFRTPTTTPKTMLMAAEFIKAKADQTEIIKHLYRTKPLSFLKLWGRAMARLNWDKSKKFIWTLLSTEDFLKSRADEKSIPIILEELKKNYPRGGIFGIFYSQESDTYGHFYLRNKRALKDLAEDYNCQPQGNTLLIKFKDKDLLKAEKDFQIALAKNL